MAPRNDPTTAVNHQKSCTVESPFSLERTEPDVRFGSGASVPGSDVAPRMSVPLRKRRLIACICPVVKGQNRPRAGIIRFTSSTQASSTGRA
jgi:hypothetical protein